MSKRLLSLGCLALHLLTAGCGGSEPAPATAASPPQPEAAKEEPAFFGGMSPQADERLAMAPAAPPSRAGGAPAPPPPPPPPAPGPAQPTPSPAKPAGEAAAMRAPMLIYTAQISMAVFEVNASLAKVETIGRDLGGFLAKRDDRSIVIRVPAAAFDEAVKRIETVGDMLHRNVLAEDVTEEFRDVEIRLRSARAVQARLTELLAKAAKVEDSLAIERELDRVSGEIERLEGRIKYLKDRAAFSTITVRFEPKPTEQVGAAGTVRLPVPWLYDINLPRLLHL